jgi:MFS family permease
MNVRNSFVGSRGVSADHTNYKWWALSCTSLGMLLVATNSGTLIIALPDLERALGTSLLTLVWVILAYMISSTVLVLTAGRLSDLFGRKTAFVGAFLIFGAVLLPAFVLIEARAKAPMLDLAIFQNRLFAAATAAAFISGLSRFALMFIFVFYYQGAQGDDPILAGLKLAPMAIGMLIASPIAGVYADRHGSKFLAAGGMLVTALGLALMTTLQAGTGYWAGGLYLFLVGVGSGMFNSPNTAAMMGTVPTERRGIAAGARTMLQNTGAVVSIAFVLAIITAAVPTNVLFAIFSGLASGLSSAQLDPFIANMHTALWVLAAISVLGAGVSMLRPGEKKTAADRTPAPRPSRALAIEEAISEEIEATP